MWDAEIMGTDERAGMMGDEVCTKVLKGLREVFENVTGERAVGPAFPLSARSLFVILGLDPRTHRRCFCGAGLSRTAIGMVEP
jgi:hypothetical protein